MSEPSAKDPSSPSANRAMNVKISDEELKGRYSNVVRISHTREEFVLDFINMFPPQGSVTARVITSPGHLKRLIRALEPADLETSFGELLELAPQLRSDRQTLPKRLGLGGRELRFIEQLLNGQTSARHAMTEGTLGPTSTLQLYALLELHDALMWTEIGERQPSIRARDARRTMIGLARQPRTTLPFGKPPGDDEP